MSHPSKRSSVPAVAALVLAAWLAAEPGLGGAPTIPVEGVYPGQRGYGITVLSGTEPVRFSVEVLGVMRSYKPGIDYILARLGGEGVERTRVASGMSGSPVFLDGRLAGAVSFTWPFSEEPVAGITPIGAMREIAALPERPGDELTAAVEPVALREILTREVPATFLERAFERLRPTGGPAGGELLWSLSGSGGERGRSPLARWLGGVGAAGRAPGLDGEHLVPGGAVSAVLVDGDFQLAATGTVTERTGEELLAFGHAFLGAGSVRVPMAPAEVVTVLSSRETSFKIANIGPVLGAFDQDRLAGVRGRIGLAAPMVPVELTVKGERPVTYRLQVAEIPPLVPGLLAASTLASLEAATRTEGAQGLDLVARFHLEEHGELVMRESFSGTGAPGDAAVLLSALAQFLQTNPWEAVRLEAVEMELVQSVAPHGASLVSVRPASAVPRAGERLGLDVELAPFRGPNRRLSLEIELPASLPPGRHTLLVGDGRSVDRVRLAASPRRPPSFDQALALLRSLHSRSDLVAGLVVEREGLTVDGTELPGLPGSMRSLWTASPSLAGAAASRLGSDFRELRVEPLGAPIQGLVRLELQVRPPAEPGGRS